MNIIELIQNMFCGVMDCPDTEYMAERIETLSGELAHCIGPVDIIEEHKSVISPHDIIRGYDMVVADPIYLSYTIGNWGAIVTRLHRHLGEKYEYTKDVYDCDDIALLYASTIAYSAYRAGLSKQPCFAIAWSHTHAYNLLIDNNDIVWVLEPQTGDILGRLEDDNGVMYDTKKIWFLS